MLVLVLSSLFSFDHKNGPKYLIECFPYVIELNRGIWKSAYIGNVLYRDYKTSLVCIKDLACS